MGLFRKGKVKEKEEEEKEISYEKVLSQLRDYMDFHIKSQAAWALMYRAKYEALVKVGFSEEQALEIIKARGLMEKIQ